MDHDTIELSRARESRAAIERLYIEMRHMLNRGSVKHIGYTGGVLVDALLTLRPEIYGSIGDSDKVELAGLVYVINRLPKGIEECRYVKLISEEGYANSHFKVLMPAQRRRKCYRIDEEHMYIEVTRGRSDVYDILTHLTFLYLESHKIRLSAFEGGKEFTHEWKKLEEIVKSEKVLENGELEVALTYLSSILGRTFDETQDAYERLEKNPDKNNGLFHVVYQLGIGATMEDKGDCREVSFSPTLRTRIGHHIYGERWAHEIKKHLMQRGLLDRPLHIISANLHSVMNSLFAAAALAPASPRDTDITELALLLSEAQSSSQRKQVKDYALAHGMSEIHGDSITHVSVQVFDLAQVSPELISSQLHLDGEYVLREKPVLVVMDYAFGEQAYETMDELLKPYEEDDKEKRHMMNVKSISIMGKAGILSGGKGDIMIPCAHIFEGTADNYPFENEFTAEDFADFEGQVFEGPMITVLGTSLQNRDVLAYFKNSTWNAIGLEMEGAHYQKAIQSQSRIRRNISSDVTLRYAYYASDNPLLTGSTLASGSLGRVGVRPTYLITLCILNKIVREVEAGDVVIG